MKGQVQFPQYPLQVQTPPAFFLILFCSLEIFLRRVTNLKICLPKHQIDSVEPKLLRRYGDVIKDFFKLPRNCMSCHFSSSPTWLHLLLCLHCSLSLDCLFIISIFFCFLCLSCLHIMVWVLNLLCLLFWADFSSQGCRWWQASWIWWWCYYPQ